MVLVESEKIVREMTPNLQMIKNLDVRGVIVTAPSERESVDFVSRFFAPAVGVAEDPVTGSAHTVLTPFWGKRLNKKQLNAQQISKRGGNLTCTDEGERVKIGGSAVTFLEGSISPKLYDSAHQSIDHWGFHRHNCGNIWHWGWCAFHSGFILCIWGGRSGAAGSLDNWDIIILHFFGLLKQFNSADESTKQLFEGGFACGPVRSGRCLFR